MKFLNYLGEDKEKMATWRADIFKFYDFTVKNILNISKKKISLQKNSLVPLIDFLLFAVTNKPKQRQSEAQKIINDSGIPIPGGPNVIPFDKIKLKGFPGNVEISLDKSRNVTLKGLDEKAWKRIHHAKEISYWYTKKGKLDRKKMTKMPNLGIR